MNDKYELTKETKVILGKTLHRIKALKSFGIVLKGELGGFIESASNLSVYDNAGVSGNAWASGDAQVYGGISISESWHLLNLIGFTYSVTITYAYIQIGCRTYAIDEYDKVFSDSELDDTTEIELLKHQIDLGLEYILHKISLED